MGFGSILVTIFRLQSMAMGRLREYRFLRCATSGSRWCPPAWRDLGPGPGDRRIAWYQYNYPWIACCLPPIIVSGTDHRPVYRSAASWGADERQQPGGTIVAALTGQTAPSFFIFIFSGIICFPLAKSERLPPFTTFFDLTANCSGPAQQAFPLLVPCASGAVAVSGGRSAGRFDEFPCGCVQASSTLFTMDFYSKFNPWRRQHQLVWGGVSPPP